MLVLCALPLLLSEDIAYPSLGDIISSESIFSHLCRAPFHEMLFLCVLCGMMKFQTYLAALAVVYVSFKMLKKHDTLVI